MNERRSLPDLTPDFGEYSLSDLLQAYARRNPSPAAPVKVDPPPSASSVPEPESSPVPELRVAQSEPEAASREPAPPETAEEIAARSRRAAMSALGETLRQYQKAHPPASEPEPLPETAPEVLSEPEDNPESGAADAQEPEPDASREESPETKPASEPEPESGRPQVTVGEDGIITLQYNQPFLSDPAETDKTQGSEPLSDGAPKSDPKENEDAVSNTEPVPAPERPVRKRLPVASSKPQLSFTERFLAPFVRRIAMILARRQMQNAEAANWPEPLDIRATPELKPGKAAKYYTSLLGPLKLRLRIALLLTVILAWIGFRLPMAGMLGRSLPLQAGVSLVLLLSVMMAALDVFSVGLRQLFDLKPGAEAVAALSAIFSALDAVLVLFGHGSSLPYCAIAAASLTAALLGEKLTCRAMRRTFTTAASTKNPSVLSSAGTKGSRSSLLRASRETVEGFVRRSESQDFCRSTYAAAAPFLLVAALLLAILASMGENGGDFLHTLSALLSVSASFAAFFAFPLPFAVASRRLRAAGAALAGYDGCADIGRNRRIVVTDEDLFPPGTVKFSEINVAEGVFLGKVVSTTAALIGAAGSGLSGLFDERVERRGYRIPPVQHFVFHEGGGLSGLIGGETVFVGSAGFMNLQGIRLPQNMQTRNAICTAIGGELVGVFVVEYIPVTSVQDALVTLIRGKTQTIFAIRDFNITPRMIGKLFRLPTDNFNFPSFRERYRIAEMASQETPIDAVFSRSGMLPMVEAAEGGRKVYSACRMTTLLSLIGTVIGMLILFLLCRVGSFDTASVGNLLTFMLLWSLPSVILSIGPNR